MSLAPTPSTSRGDVVLQPNYFTSSVYVKALRDDISTLVFRFHEAFSQPGCTKPFALFKAVWLSLGWNWLQFKVFDSRSRHTFLDVTLRLFLERTVKTEAPFTRVVALFGMYVFYYTQIKDTFPALYSITNIPIPCGTYCVLHPGIVLKTSVVQITMPDSLTNAHTLPLQPYARYVLSCLQRDLVFHIFPKSDLGAANPRELPREIFTEDGMAFLEQGSQKRKGRPARREKGKKARAALDNLEKWTAEDEQGSSEIDKALSEYTNSKATMLGADGTRLPKGSVEKVGEIVVARLKETQESEVQDDGDMIPRLEEILEGQPAGIFGLVTH
ncbi:hypothetical protein CVT25_005719 [Psilocybe cyanescens]|uniref:Uncharacterized protein n=1 Tax=Psilocybe cyanescens TaxID=93625 RepID=A0A409VLL0_PSICY|nr:hypothetical protein CVT25_005719 [Psilocybe cyanescens]